VIENPCWLLIEHTLRDLCLYRKEVTLYRGKGLSRLSRHWLPRAPGSGPGGSQGEERRAQRVGTEGGSRVLPGSPCGLRP